MGIRDLAGHTLGQYELREILGVGGMGAVYRGYQPALQRAVAVKVISPELLNQPDYIDRFYREARIAAALEHAHIVPIYDYGVQGDISYVVMRLLTGGTLTERLTRQDDAESALPSLNEIATMLGQLASALDYAHSQGVVHRDIKPSNVMFDNRGDAFLVDFGIAKLLAATQAITTSGVVMGTPLFMPPEQWRAEEVTPASDQYALGVMTYVLITGRLPFEADTPHGLMYKHLTEPPTPPQVYRPDIPRAVTQVLERTLAKKGEERFPTVTAYAQAFEKAIQGYGGEKTNFFTAPLRPTKLATTRSPLSPRPPAARFPLRWAALIGVIGLVAIVILVLALNGSGKNGGGMLPDDQVGTAAAQTVVAMNIVPSPTATSTETRRAAPTATKAAAAPPTSTTVPITTAPTIAVLPETQVWLDISATARSWTPTHTPEPTGTPDFTATYAAQMALVGQTLTAEGWTDTPTPTSTATATPTNTPTPSDTPSATPTATLTPTATFTATPSTTPSPTATPVPPQKISAANVDWLEEKAWVKIFGDPEEIHWSTDGRTLVTSTGFTVALFDPADLQEDPTLQKDTNGFVHAVAVSLDGVTVAYGDGDNNVVLWNMRTDAETVLRGHTSAVQGVAFSADGTRLASASWDTTVRIWDVATGKELAFFTGFTNFAYAVAFRPDGQILAAVGQHYPDEGVRLWDTQTFEELPILATDDSVACLAFSPDGRLLVAGEEWDIQWHIWDAQTFEPVLTMGQSTSEPEGGTCSVAFSPDSSLMATGGGDKLIDIWDVAAGSATFGQELATLRRHTDTILALAFSPDGTMLASGGGHNDSTIRLWGISPDAPPD